MCLEIPFSTKLVVGYVSHYPSFEMLRWQDFL